MFLLGLAVLVSLYLFVRDGLILPVLQNESSQSATATVPTPFPSGISILPSKGEANSVKLLTQPTLKFSFCNS